MAELTGGGSNKFVSPGIPRITFKRIIPRCRKSNRCVNSIQESTS